MKLSGSGISVSIPDGWEGAITPGGAQPDGAMRHAVLHLANFALPARRGDYGGGAVDLMRPGDVLVVLLEFGDEAASQPLFAFSGLPLPLRTSDFHRDTLQRRIEGHGGCQRFFNQSGRAFCLYVVVGSHLDRADILPQLNQVLGSIVIER